MLSNRLSEKYQTSVAYQTVSLQKLEFSALCTSASSSLDCMYQWILSYRHLLF